MYDLRLWLSKKGSLKYVSHLDMFRLMQRAVRRAGIPLWYTEGFNPHPYISFLLALSLGIEGEGEPVDLRIVGEMTPEEVRERLNAVLPRGLSVVAAAPPQDKPAAIAFGRYDVYLDPAQISGAELQDVLAGGGLTCQKSGKSGHKKIMKTVDVSAQLREWQIEEKDGSLLLHVVLPAGSTVNLNPLQLLEAVSEKRGAPVYALSAVRTALLKADGKEFR